MNQLISSILENGMGWGGHGGHLLYGVLVEPGKLGASLERESCEKLCSSRYCLQSLPNPRSLVRSGTVQRIRPRYQPNSSFLLLYLVNKQSWLLNFYFLEVVRRKKDKMKC